MAKDFARSPFCKNGNQLKLARSGTSKVQAVLRKEEVLPNVVIHPHSEHAVFGYNFNRQYSNLTHIFSPFFFALRFLDSLLIIFLALITDGDASLQ